MSQVHTTSSFIRPAVRLMQRLSMPVKMMAMASVVVIPLLMVAFVLSKSMWDQRLVALSELSGLKMVNQIADVVIQRLSQQTNSRRGVPR